jgi:site-specific DNA-methyltransferase (adenine-specific)
MFPEELPSRLIKMFSFPGETVLDPFLGSGTTAAAARKLNRNSHGYEVNADFIPIIKEKIGGGDMFSTHNIISAKQIDTPANFDEKIDQLPYRFHDVHKLDKKTDIKKLQYGSKIDATTPAVRQDYYTVKEIISPELVRLNNDLTVRLIGIKQDPSVNGAATEFLQKKLKNTRVFFKHDENKFDADNNLFVYLYTENKTFVNAHLLKNKLVLVDENSDFRHKEKFLALLHDAQTKQEPTT